MKKTYFMLNCTFRIDILRSAYPAAPIYNTDFRDDKGYPLS